MLLFEINRILKKDVHKYFAEIQLNHIMWYATSLQFNNQYYWDQYRKWLMKMSCPGIPIIDRNEYPCNIWQWLGPLSLSTERVTWILSLYFCSWLCYKESVRQTGNDIINAFTFFSTCVQTMTPRRPHWKKPMTSQLRISFFG